MDRRLCHFWLELWWVCVMNDQIGLGYNLVGTVIAALRMGLHSSAITFERGTDGCLAHMSRYTVCSIMA